MKMFKMLVKILQDDGVLLPTGGGAGGIVRCSEEGILTTVNNNRAFLRSKAHYLDVESQGDIVESRAFEQMSIENADRSPLYKFQGRVSQQENMSGSFQELFELGGVDQYCMCMIVFPTGIMSLTFTEEYGYRAMFSSEMSHGEAFLREINNKTIGSIPVSERISTKKPGNPKKKVHTTKDHVFIVGNTVGRKDVECRGKKIDWTHTWEVRGHWRSVPGLGKNYKGELTEYGRTWIRPCTKGVGELVKKMRIN